MAGLRLHLLGKPEAWLDDAPLTEFSTAKTEALLYYLAVTKGPHSRETLAELLWGDMPDAAAKRNLTKALSTLRRLVGPYLVVERQSVAFNTELPCQLDINTFETLIAWGQADAGLSSLREAVALYRGDFLEGFYVKEALSFDEWAVAQRERLREVMAQALDALVTQLTERQDYGPGIEYARRLLDLDPWHEAAHRRLMILLARRGQSSAALAQYEKCRQSLADELGVEPMAETTALYERIQAARTLIPRPLPAEAEPFVGRTAELAQISQMLASPTCRLVTIVGIGGSGKTRLALAAARHLNREGALRFINGVLFIPLAEVRGPTELPLALADALELPLTGNSDPATVLIHFLHNKEMLLVLDNFEHLMEAAAWLTQLLSQCLHLKLLVTSREPLQLGVEWRLNLEGLAYPPTDDVARSADDAARFEAVELFVQATRQVRPDYELSAADAPHVYHLCRLVAGMPLALRLAAAKMRALPPERIVAEVQHNLDSLTIPMRDLPPRQRSLRASFDHTWQLMVEEERKVNAALSVFRGGFTEVAARQVVGATTATLAGLVDCGVVLLDKAAADTRYTLHELARQYAAEKLAQSAEAEHAARQQHSAYFLNLLKTHAARLIGPEQHTAVAEIAHEIDNIQAAWRWAVSQRALNAIDAVMDALYNFYQIRSRFQEGEELFAWTTHFWQSSQALRDHPHFDAICARLSIRWSAFSVARHDYRAAQERLRSALELIDQPRERALALSLLGTIAIDHHAERAAAERYLHESLGLSREIGDVGGMASALLGLAKAAFEFGDFVPAAQLASQGLALCRQLHRPDWIAKALGVLAWPTNCLGDYGAAEAYWQESLALYQEIGDALGVAVNVNFLGWAAWCVGGARLPEASAYHEKALVTFREFGHRQRLAMCLGDLALATLELGDCERAIRYAREGLAVAREIGVIHLMSYNLTILGAAASEQGDKESGRKHLAEALQTSLQARKVDSVMNVLYFFARLLLHDDPSARKQTRALELLSLVVHHPATWQPIRDRASRLRDEQASITSVAASLAAPDQPLDLEGLAQYLRVDLGLT